MAINRTYLLTISFLLVFVYSLLASIYDFGLSAYFFNIMVDQVRIAGKVVTFDYSLDVTVIVFSTALIWTPVLLLSIIFFRKPAFSVGISDTTIKKLRTLTALRMFSLVFSLLILSGVSLAFILLPKTGISSLYFTLHKASIYFSSAFNLVIIFITVLIYTVRNK